MALPPNTANYTVPGGVKLFFDDGTGERDLGNIVNVDMTPGTEELEHYSNRSGKRMKDLSLIIEEKLTIKFTMDEPVIENWKYFLKGGDIEPVGEGTAAKVDQKVTFDGVKMMSIGQYYSLTGVSVRSFLDYVYHYDFSALEYLDNSVEARSVAGSPFVGIDGDADFIYMGKLTKFGNIRIDVANSPAYGTALWEYWNGAEWTTFVPTGDAAAILMEGDGNVICSAITALMELTTINGTIAYWVRVSLATTSVAATFNGIGTQVGVVNVEYIVDVGEIAASGRIPGRLGRLTGGRYVDGEEVMISFTYVTLTSSRFSIAGMAMAEGSARLEVHPSVGRGIKFDIEIPKCQLKPEGNISLDDKKWLEMSMTLEVLDDTTNNPLYPLGRFVMYE